ncbi:MAG: endolytic transglycosylase MltG [Actinomycetota bacterium]|nr:endolytic transglycosylase MltG [Actinomycetota bacterium]
MKLALAVGVILVAVVVAGCRHKEPPPAPVETTPPLARLRIIFPEGFTRREMVERVGAVHEIAIRERRVTPKLTAGGYRRASAQAMPPAEFRKDWSRTHSSEGFLFPATYEFTKVTTSEKLVRDQLALFRRRWRSVDLRYARSKNLTPYDVLTIASMIEKETVAPEERWLVSAVIYNRLRNGMALGIDATIRYGRNVPGTESLKQSDLESDSPYNTRERLGLPPTPISNPGLASIRAAARPARVDYLFFVRKPDEVHHFFTASESEFFQKKCEYGFGC